MPYAMFKDYWKYDWVLPVHRYEGLVLLTLADEGAIRSTLPIGHWESMIIEVYLPKPQAPSNGLPVRIRLQF